MRILALTRYGPKGASSRMRSFQFLPALRAKGWEVAVMPFLDDEKLAGRYRAGGYELAGLFDAYWTRVRALLGRSQFDLLWIEKEALPWLPAWFESLLLRGVPYVLDFDDAIFHKYDLHRLSWVRRIYGRRLDRLMAKAHMVVAGNRYLGERARRAGARYVEILPTVVDLVRYRTKSYPIDSKKEGAPVRAAKPRVVWIGSPSTVRYLLGIAQELSALAKMMPFTLRVIGGGLVEMPGVNVENLEWTAETEVDAIRECDVGIMPLLDSPWEKGKCAYKLIQYMACGLPTVASPVGANLEVVLAGETGLFADSAGEWVENLRLLLSDSGVRERLGVAGRCRVEQNYSLQVMAPKLIEAIEGVGLRRSNR